MKILHSIKVLFAAALFTTSAVAQDKALDLDALLKQLEEGKFQQNEQNAAREREFQSKVADQDRMLRQAEAARQNEVNLSERLETQFEENEFKIADLKEAVDNRLGSLKELFGVLQQVAGDSSGKFTSSIISAQFPGRDQFMDDLAQSMGQSANLASIEEIERVWFELQREMTESGKVSRFTTEVVEAGGTKATKEVVRVGSFALIADGQYLELIPESGSVAELVRQPQARFGNSAAALQNSNGEIIQFGLDPTGGTIMGLLVQSPTLKEKVEQGGLIGYIILAVGAVGILVSVWRFIVLFSVGAKVNSQLKSETIKTDNPLGRVLKVREEFPNVDTETLELKLTEAILGEVPKLSSFLTLVKMISVVAPLGGLLGTVTGMIVVFQQITLFGTGDPKLMAGGISTALVTTVLGLVVAIPTTLLYAALNTRSKGIVNILQEQASGVIAERAERG